MSEDKHFLTAKDILDSNDLETAEMEVPEWGGTLRLRVMTADEAIKFQDVLNTPAKKSAWVKLLALCAVDADGNRLFSDREMELLKKKSTAVFLRLQDFLLKLNGFTQEAADKAKND